MKSLAHSAQPQKGILEQSYKDHIFGTFQRAQKNINQMLEYSQIDNKDAFSSIVLWAAEYHDLGKLDEENQKVLQGIKKAKHLPINHVDAGVAYLKEKKKIQSALLVFSHHCGLPLIATENLKPYPYRDTKIMDKTDEYLKSYLLIHYDQINIKHKKSEQFIIPDGLSRRLALSCLVDADHSDTAQHTRLSYLPKWEERLEKLDKYVQGKNEESEKNERNELRHKIYQACRNNIADHSIYYCDSPVGTGKTTSIMAHLLNVAIKKKLRHIIVVLPFTNIITQSVKIFRQALVLDDEDPETIVAEHDHQADFSSFESREIASLWNAPIIVTTAVQFFESIGSNVPSRLRKLHELPGTGIFIDESHAAIPTWLWPQAWDWLWKLTKDWGCHLVLASGTTSKFWEIDGFIDTRQPIPALVPEELRKSANKYEQTRVKLMFNSANHNANEVMNFDKIEELIGFVVSKTGPRIIIMNTVYSAAYLAKEMRDKGYDVLHLSTALTPKDREPIIEEVYKRLKRNKLTKELNYKDDWTLVATSCVEAGLNFSFKNGFAELRSIQSCLQIDGRVNREGEYVDSEMWCFTINSPHIKLHPGFKTSQKVFTQLIESNLINKLPITELVTEAIKRELKEDWDEKVEKIIKCESNHEYPEVAKLCKIIDTDTRLVVMDSDLITILENGEKISSIQLIKNSVQIWATKIDEFRLLPIKGYEEIYKWPNDGYDPEFLGYMKEVLNNKEMLTNALII